MFGPKHVVSTARCISPLETRRATILQVGFPPFFLLVLVSQPQGPPSCWWFYRCSSSSDDEKEKTEDRRAFKRDFLATLEARILEIRSRGRGVVLVRLVSLLTTPTCSSLGVPMAHSWQFWFIYAQRYIASASRAL